jgi:Flp pilus assembly protein TadB
MGYRERRRGTEAERPALQDGRKATERSKTVENRLSQSGVIGHPAWITSLILVKAAFGVAHRYQGMTGIFDEALMGLILGLIYFAWKQQRWRHLSKRRLQLRADLPAVVEGLVGPW